MQVTYSSPDFEKQYTYPGTDLGVSWRREAVFFRLWAPTARAVTVRIYSGGTPGGDDLLRELPMDPDTNGTWRASLPGDWNGKYYTYLVTHDKKSTECCDPYAVSTGVNGHRAMILDLRSTDPAGWDRDSCIHWGKPLTDAVIYEAHIRDLTVDSHSGVLQKGKYLGLCQRGTALSSGRPTALDHILSLGVTHVQLQPVYDYGSVDEAGDLEAQYNWGYDPVNYNVPEGSYATNPFHGEVRVKELKTLIRTLHENGLGVFMDVVYNHVYDSSSFCFNSIVPGYFSRPESNGSGCGNDTASERGMVRKYIIDSLKHWVREYHIDGFRFDLAGLIDVQTIHDAMEEIHRTHPHVHFYGEGWCMQSLATKPDTLMTDQTNSALLPGFGFFNDTFRDLLRGSVFDSREKGYLTGKTGNKNALRSCFMGVTPWACSPAQSINYISCHDNHTLFDRLSLGLPRASKEDIVRRCRLGAAFTVLSQGVPFLLAGEELGRSKPLGNGAFDENSYRSPDHINSIKWAQMDQSSADYYRGLIQFRKAHDCLRQTDRDGILSSIKPIPCSDPHTLIFRVQGDGEKLFIFFNAGNKAFQFVLPDGSWELHIDSDSAGITSIGSRSGTIRIPPLSAMVLVQPESRKMTEVAAAMICRGDEFLICQRPEHKARGLLWEFPGGKLEPGETGAEALIRECMEELGIKVNVQDIAARTEHRYPDIHIRLTLYRCVLSSGEPSPLEHKALRWIHMEETPEYSFSPADLKLLCMMS